jgi:hypothetical protein
MEKKNKSKYFVLDSRTFADALNLLGFSFYVFQNNDGKKVYSFENSEIFQEGYQKLCALRKEFRDKLNK